MRVHLKKLSLPAETELEALGKDELVALAKLWRETLDQYQGILFRVRRQLFGRKSEKSPGDTPPGADAPAHKAPRGDTTKRPSARYPGAPIREDEIDFLEPPACGSCGVTMQDSGMTEDSEYLDVQTKEFTVVQQKRHKHRCSRCHGAIATAPSPPRVTPGGSYSDNLIVDATLSKYCDLVPMGRYSQMAARGGFPGLPPHSLIQASFRLADFLSAVYQLIKEETLKTEVLLADETPHRMLEGDAKKRWYLWGFSSQTACFFECHDTRSGDVSTEVLKSSTCLVLLTDVYSGYKKSVKEANKLRVAEGLPPIKSAYCNAHARRAFFSGDHDQEKDCADAKSMADQYAEIYRINSESKKLSAEGVTHKRAEMNPIFAAMRDEAEKKINAYSNKSQMGSAYGYFLNNYDGLTLFLTNPNIPIDNNASERLLRSPVVGRKTWYGTHSRKGAAAAAVHFSIVETCKKNGVNPRKYYQDMIARTHKKQVPMTPSQYKNLPPNNSC